MMRLNETRLQPRRAYEKREMRESISPLLFNRLIPRRRYFTRELNNRHGGRRSIRELL